MNPPPLRPFLRLPGGLAPLGFRNYLLFWIGYAASNTGRWIELTGSVWLVYELTESPALLGLVGIAGAVPSVVLSPIAGVVADRVDQRRLLFATQTVAMTTSLTIGLLVATGRIELWHLYAQIACQAAIAAFDAAGRQALFPRLVPRARLSEAVTLTATASHVSKLVGPAIGGIAIARLGEASPFLINGGTFLTLMVAVALMRHIAPVSRLAGSSFRSELVEGLSHIRRAPVLSGLLKLEIVFSVFQMNEVMITIFAREVLDVGPEGLGILLSAPAAGSLLAILLLVLVGHAHRQGRFVVACIVGYSLALITLAGSRWFPVSLLALATTGLLDAFATVTRHSVMQLATPSRMRGRVMANMGTITRGVGPLAQTQSGVLSAALGGPLAVVVAAAVLATAATGTARINRRLWAFRRDDLPDPDDETSPAAR